MAISGRREPFSGSRRTRRRTRQAKQQLDADLLTSGVRRSAAEDAQRQRSVQEPREPNGRAGRGPNHYRVL